MWRLAERQGDQLQHIADFRSEGHATSLYRDVQGRQGRNFVLYHSGYPFDTPLPWRVWAISPRTGLPHTLLIATQLRALSEAYIRDRRPVTEEWVLFRLESNGDQLSFPPDADRPVEPLTVKPVAPAEPLPPVPKKPRRRAIRV